jgi:hypothetical protein
MNKREKEQLRQQQWCQQYLKPDWDGCAAVEYFARFQESDPENKYANKPNYDFFVQLQDMHYAHNDAYCVVIPAFVKEEVVERLEKSLQMPITIPSRVQNPDTYKSTFIKTVKEILENIRLEKYPFQKNNFEFI